MPPLAPIELAHQVIHIAELEPRLAELGPWLLGWAEDRGRRWIFHCLARHLNRRRNRPPAGEDDPA
jgi:hypothetical protein